MKHTKILSSVCLILTITSIAMGGSIFASRGLGLPYTAPNARSLGLGGVQLSNYDTQNISSMNPATMSAIEMTSLSIQYIHDVIKSKDAVSQETSDYGNLQGFDFIIPFGKEVSMALSLRPLTRTDYYLNFEVEQSSAVTYLKTIKSSGGLNAASMSASWGLHSMFKLGMTGHYYFGKFSEGWAVTYNNSGFTSTKDEFTTRSFGWGYTLGAIVLPLPHLSIGATLTPHSTLDTKTDLSSTFNDSLLSKEGSFTYPASWGLGISYRITDLGMVGLDIKSQSWGDLKINERKKTDIKNTLGYCLGFEIRRSDNPYASYMRRMAYRAGLFYTSLPMLDNAGDSIVESGFSVGLGLPLMMNKAYIDFAFMMGKRGSIDKNDLEENIYRFSLNISGTEKWFQRRY